MENNEQYKRRAENAEAPQKRKPRKKKGSTVKSVLVYLTFILAISAVLSYFVITLSNDVFAFLKEEKEVVMVIEAGDDIASISKRLGQEGVVEHSWLFKLFVNLSASDTTFTRGTHTLDADMDYREILNELQKSTEESKANTVRVTIPEGYTLEQMAVLFEENEVVSAEAFLETAQTHDFEYVFITEREDVLYQLEGFLFPDTYDFYINDNPVTVINKMINNFSNKIDGEIMDKAEALGLSINEVVTIASLIEREAAKQDEQQTISGVIHNRLNSSAYPFLNIDATIQYASGHREDILQVDLDKDGPYNTYTQKGLVPGAIANPGQSALYAAVNPEKHDYYFYVAKPDGYHIFTKNLDEHNKAVAEARKMS